VGLQGAKYHQYKVKELVDGPYKQNYFLFIMNEEL
jgi:hypothetical protein